MAEATKIDHLVQPKGQPEELAQRQEVQNQSSEKQIVTSTTVIDVTAISARTNQTNQSDYVSILCFTYHKDSPQVEQYQALFSDYYRSQNSSPSSPNLLGHSLQSSPSSPNLLGHSLQSSKL